MEPNVCTVGVSQTTGSKTVKSGVDTANRIVNTAGSLRVLLYSFIVTLELLGLTFLHCLVPHLVGLQRNKVLYATYHKHNWVETLSV